MSIRSRATGDRGVALTEAALILPFVIFVLIGVFESGFAYRDSNILARATDQAARSDSRLADSDTADYEALRALQSGLSSLSASSIERVIIFDATNTDRPSNDCMTTIRPNDLTPVGFGGASACNVYSDAQVQTNNPAAFGCGPGAFDAAHCPTTRDRATPDPDRLGVYVKLSYDKVTAVLPGSLTLERTVIYQLEPCIAGAATC